MSTYSKKKGKKVQSVQGAMTPPNMNSDDIDPTTVLFGQPLSVAARRSDSTWGAIPSPIRIAVDWLNKKGLNEEGLYRVPGRHTTFLTYKALFDRGVEFDFFELHEMAPENVAMVLIKYLQALPEPIYCTKFEAHFRLALAIVNEQERASVMRGIMYMLPLAHRETIRVLVDHLKLVASNSEKNKMTMKNLEVTWSLSVGQTVGAIVRILSESPFPVPSTLQFSIPLEEAVQNAPRSTSETTTMVPFAVTKCVEWLKENQGFMTPLLFSSEPSNPSIIDDIVYVLNGGSLGTEGAFPAETIPSDVGVVIKHWIASIPGDAGLFPDSMRPDFVRICVPPTDSTSNKPPNFSQMPDKLEALIWKLPDPHLETIKALITMLDVWTATAPEDMTTLQAVEILFPSYPSPLQYVLAYLLHHCSALFSPTDSELVAHLQTLVFGNNMGMLSPPAITSPRYQGFAPKTVGSPIPLTLQDATSSDSTSHVPKAADAGGENNGSGPNASTSNATASGSEPSTPIKISGKKAKTLKEGLNGKRIKKTHREDSAPEPGTESPSDTKSPTPKSEKTKKDKTRIKKHRKAASNGASPAFSKAIEEQNSDAEDEEAPAASDSPATTNPVREEEEEESEEDQKQEDSSEVISPVKQPESEKATENASASPSAPSPDTSAADASSSATPPPNTSSSNNDGSAEDQSIDVKTEIQTPKSTKKPRKSKTGEIPDTPKSPEPDALDNLESTPTANGKRKKKKKEEGASEEETPDSTSESATPATSEAGNDTPSKSPKIKKKDKIVSESSASASPKRTRVKVSTSETPAE